MMTFEQKYLKYKSKYLALKIGRNIPNQNGGSTNIFEITNLSETPVFIANQQRGGGGNNIFEISNLSETPNFDNNQNGGKNNTFEESSSSSDSKLSTISTASSGGGKKSKNIKKYLAKDSTESDLISNSSSSTNMSLSDSTESLLSALEDSDSQ